MNIERRRIYYIWKNMKQRCNNPNNKGWINYGARGIFICQDWWSFENFYQWSISNGYDSNKSIDRIDNNGHYTPSNCRWVTYFEQSRNKKTNINITAWGETKIATDWIGDPRVKVCYATFIRRIKEGWNHELALTQPKKSTAKIVTAFGESKTIKEWTKDHRCVVKELELRKRLNNNWSPELALSRKYERPKKVKSHKFSRKIAIEICNTYNSKKTTILDIAYEFGCSENIVSLILRGKYYEDISKTMGLDKTF